ncbi:hypothetical protein HF324_29190 [Chitinophaga oryzae]|uniref:Fasciclin domain-containing protein n=1 Tax=Chitinophaga oryzae TaxID=2725414 RepID=A0ABX6LNH1_9BACT|nr:hypothetical protein [Chitinophaga oryzae]QJB41702.1 hypothetical protein HF324_29190 [Chitinophaga oryzae]
MKNKIYRTIQATILCGAFFSIGLLHTGCRKEMFMPEPEGETVPYKDSASADIRAVLKSSPYKLFYAAWQRSNIEEVLMALGARASVTVLAVDDASMKAAGLDETEIGKRSPEELNTLMRYHMLNEKLEPLTLQTQKMSSPRMTMLENPNLTEYRNGSGSGVGRPYAYTYRHFMAMAKDSQLIIDGQLCGNYPPVAARNGIIWPVNRLLQKPEKHVREILEEDGRFTMLLAINDMNEASWMEYTFGSFVRYGGYFWNVDPASGAVVFNSYLAPTDEAFHQAGIQDITQVMDINSRFIPELDWESYKMTGLIPTDSILDYHNWGRSYAPTDNSGFIPSARTVFYSNDLDDKLIGDYWISLGNTTTAGYKMPLQFIREGNTIKVKLRSANTPPATIIARDINTFEGPLHLVDRLFLPDNFKVN